MLVINLFGGPCTGKSRTSAGLFFNMKNSSNVRSVESVTEFAKDLVYAERFRELQPDNQLYVTSKQYHRMHKPSNQVDYLITDSPLLSSLAYCGDDFFPSFEPLVHELHGSFNNLNVLLNRVNPYQTYGRTQTEEEAIEKDVIIKSILDDNGFDYFNVNGDINAPEVIMGLIGV